MNHGFIRLAPSCRPPGIRRTIAPGVSFPFGTRLVTVAFFDADSTLRVAKSGEPTAQHANDVLLLPGIARGLRKAAQRGHFIAVVSNQGGVHLGENSFMAAQAALGRTAALLYRYNAPVHYFDFAEHYDRNRKPAPGMARRLDGLLLRFHGVRIDWGASYMVGDAGWKKNEFEPDGRPGEDFSNSDREFAERLRIPYHHPRIFFGWNDFGIRNFHHPRQVRLFWYRFPAFPR